MSCDVGEVTDTNLSVTSLRHNSFSNPPVALLTSQLILQPFRCFSYVTVHSATLLSLLLCHKLFTEFNSAHSPTFPSLHLRHSSFSNPSVASPTSQFILLPFFRFSYVTSSSLNSTLLILQPFRHFTYVTTHSPALPSLFLRHRSFYNPSVASPTSQFIFQPFFRFSYVTRSSLNSPGEPSMAFVEYFFLIKDFEKNHIYFSSHSKQDYIEKKI